MSKKEKILEVALELFASQGVDKTSTAQITKKAGVAEGTLFVHFKNKQALVDAIYVYIKEREYTAFARVLSKEQNAKENTYTLSKKVIDYFLDHTIELQYVLHVQQLDLISENAKEQVAEFGAVIFDYMKEWQKNGEIKKTDLSLLGQQTWSMLVATIMYCKKNKKKVTNQMVQPIWDALKA